MRKSNAYTDRLSMRPPDPAIRTRSPGNGAGSPNDLLWRVIYTGRRQTTVCDELMRESKSWDGRDADPRAVELRSAWIGLERGQRLH